MGKEERESKKVQEIGKYNVKITLIFMGAQSKMLQEVIKCKMWIHAENFLAVTLFDGTLKIVCLD